MMVASFEIAAGAAFIASAIFSESLIFFAGAFAAEECACCENRIVGTKRRAAAKRTIPRRFIGRPPVPCTISHRDGGSAPGDAEHFQALSGRSGVRPRLVLSAFRRSSRAGRRERRRQIDAHE